MAKGSNLRWAEKSKIGGMSDLRQVATEEEKKDEKVLLGNIYNDKVASIIVE